MQVFFDLVAGERVTIEGREHIFERLLPPEDHDAKAPDSYLFLDHRTKRPKELSQVELHRIMADGKLELHRIKKVAGDTVGYDETPLKAMQRRQRYFWVSIFDESPCSRSVQKLAEFIERHKDCQPDHLPPPSPNTLIKWLRERGEQGARRPSQMGNRVYRHPRRKPVHSYVQAAYDTASDRYWGNYRVLREDVQVEVRASVIRENERRYAEGLNPLKVPGRSTVLRWIKQDETYENVVTRHGRHIADQRFKALGQPLKPKRINDMVMIDQKLMDVHLCDSTRRFVLGRPWLAVAMDVKSRMIVGISLSFEPPSLLSVMSCIRSAMRGQPNLKVRYPAVEGEWEAFGLPRMVIVDNAWENTGSAFVEATAECGITVQWAAVRRPQQKGHLERWFGRLDRQLAHKLPGGIVDNPTALAVRRIDPRTDSCLTLAELEELLFRYIVDDYSIQDHRGLGSIPLKVWRDDAQLHGIELCHNIAEAEHAMSRMVRDRTLDHEGVRWNGLVYRADEVTSLLNDLLPLQGAGVATGSAKVRFNYHPEDVSKIFVWNELRKRYVVLPCVQKDYARGLSERVHNELKAQMRQANAKFISEDKRLIARAETVKAAQDAYGLVSQKERLRKARLVEPRVDPDYKAKATHQTIMSDSIGNTQGGNQPEKTPARTRKAKQQAASRLWTVEPEELVFADPFADRDPLAEIARSKKRMSS